MDSFFVVACFESFLHNLPALYHFIIVSNLFEDLLRIL